MPIVDMKKVFLLAHRQERQAILDLLYRMGAVELADVRSSDTWQELDALLEPETEGENAPAYEKNLAEVRYCLDFMQRYFPVRKGFVEQFTGSKMELTGEEYAQYLARSGETDAIYASCREAEDKLARIRNEETRCQNLWEELQPWADFALPLGEVHSSKRVVMGLAALAEEDYSGLQEALAEEVPDFYLEEVIVSRKMAHIFYIYTQRDSEKAASIFKEATVTLVPFPGVEETAAAAIAGLEAKLAELDQERETVIEEVEKLLEHRPLLMALYDYLDNERVKQEAAAKLARTERSFLMEGWVPEPALKNLEEAVATETKTGLVVARDPEKYEETPVLLQNKGPVEAYEVVTKLYSTPRQDELDPTPYMAPFFFIFFGICLADVGYGVVLSLLAFLLTKKLKLAGMGKQLVHLLFLGGISSAVFGVILGGYVGDLFGLAPLWLNPLEGDGPVIILILCFALGVIHMFFGMGVQAYRNIIAGKPLDAILDQGLWFLLICGLIMLVLPGIGDAAMWIVICGLAGLLLTQGRRQKGLLRKLLSGLGSLYNITGYLSDVLSYSRLLALGLSTAVIAVVINVMADLMAGSVAGYIIMPFILVGGHMFNLLIGVLGAYVHTSRLQYIEFFGKFFEGGGKAFKPFREKTRFVDVTETEADLSKADAEKGSVATTA